MKQTKTNVFKLHPRRRKVHEFLLWHPQLFNQLKQAFKEQNEGYQLSLPFRTTKTNLFKSYYLIESMISSYYLHRIVDLSMHLINLSTMDRKERVNLRVELKRLAWECEEDFNEQKIQSLEFYLNEFLSILLSYQKKS